MVKTEEEYKRLCVKEFDKAAEKYETKTVSVYNLCKQDYPPILKEIENIKFESLLDAGCGTAPMISLLKEKFPDKKYTGIDLSPKMIEQAKKKNLENVEFIVGDCENLPFDENTFDVVITSQSFHHYPNPQNYFNSVYKVLRPGGKFILRDNTMNKSLLWMVNKIEVPILHLIGLSDVKVYSLDEVRAFCDHAGLKVEKLEQQSGLRLHLVASKN